MSKVFSISDQAFFAQRLSLLLQSGISTAEALSMMMNMESSSLRKRAYGLLIENIHQGVSLGKSIKNTSVGFDSLLLALIQNGEASGYLSEALMQAHTFLEKRNEMKKKIIGSLLYPIFIICATVCMTLFLILYIFPKILPLLKSMDIQLPLITRIIQEMYFIFSSYGIWICGGLCILTVAFRLLLKKSMWLRYSIDLYCISLPIIGRHMRTYYLSSVCRMGEMLLSSGRSLPDTLMFSEESSRNIIYKRLFRDMHKEAVQGSSLAASLRKRNKFIHALVADMVAVGEKTGTLALMLGHCSRIFEQDIDNTLKKVSSLLEPALMVLMGLIVGSVALSIILPVYEITNHLSR